MDWTAVAQSISTYAPLLSGVLAATGVGAPAAAAVALAGKLVSSALGVPNTPDDVALALKTDPDAAVKLRQIEADHGDHLAAIAQQAQAAQLAAAAGVLGTVNTTMQVEDRTKPFSWRDAWGYVSAACFAVVVGVCCYLSWSAVRYGNVAALAAIPQIVGAFTPLFGIALVVLGVKSSIEAYHTGVVDRINAGEVRQVGAP